MGDFAAAWHHEYYEELENAGPDRATQAWRDLELHVLSPFDRLLTTNLVIGRSMVKGWLRTMSGRPPLTAGSCFTPSPVPYARQTTNGFLWLLRQVLAHARHLGYDVPDYAEGRGIRALAPLGRDDRRAMPLVSLKATAALAGHLHVIHQTVLWLLRCCGLRISESYGLTVGDFFLDVTSNGFLSGGAQGGRNFLVRSDSGTVVATNRKDAGKTESANRLVALPALLTALLLEVIEVFHRDDDGLIDPSARLVPTIRSEGGGQGGFRNALSEAAQVIGESGIEDAYCVTPHDFRKSFSTDLAWGNVPRLAARRAMGHRVGVDVFDAVYTLDSRLAEHLLPVARQLEQEFSTAGVTTLMVPTSKRPACGRSVRPERIAAVDRKLLEAGWQVQDDPKLLGTREVAALLDRDLQATRRLFGKQISATKVGREWCCNKEDVLAFIERTTAGVSLEQIAERAGVDYYAVYRMMRRLGIEAATTDTASRALLLSPEDAGRLVTELSRLRLLDERSVGVRRAAAMLQTSTSAIYRWARAGTLAWDKEQGVGGARRITRTSIDRQSERLARQPASITVSDFKEATELDDVGIRALVTAKLLVRVRPDGLTPESVRTWAAGIARRFSPAPCSNGNGTMMRTNDGQVPPNS